MQAFVIANVEEGQKNNQYNKLIAASTLTTIIIGAMRMNVLKWQLSKHETNLVKDGKTILEGIVKLIEQE